MLDWLEELFSKFCDVILSFLPTDPFYSYLSEIDYDKINSYLGYVAYFIPIDFLMSCIAAFLVSLGAYYLIVIVLRWVKVVS